MDPFRCIAKPVCNWAGLSAPHFRVGYVHIWNWTVNDNLFVLARDASGKSHERVTGVSAEGKGPVQPVASKDWFGIDRHIHVSEGGGRRPGPAGVRILNDLGRMYTPQQACAVINPFVADFDFVFHTDPRIVAVNGYSERATGAEVAICLRLSRLLRSCPSDGPRTTDRLDMGR